MERDADSYQQDYFQRVRRRTLALQAMGPLALVVVWLADSALSGTPLWTPARGTALLLGMAGLAALMATLPRIATPAAHGWVTIAMLCVAELSLAFIVTPTAQALAWVMPVMMALPLAAAPFWVRHTRAIACCVLCYACAGTVLYRMGAEAGMAAYFLAQAALFSCTSLAVFHTIDRLRRSAYAFQLDLEHEARHDALTGLLSRRRFLSMAEAEAEAQARAGGRYALCFMDLDRFKEINDRHGHAAGDRALARVAGLLLARIPAGALAARMGGEEFVMLLPGADAQTARAFAESLRLEIQRQDMQGFTLTISAGVASHRRGEALKQTLHRADTALLAAKQRGRNRVEVDPLEMDPMVPPA